jgi:hypothetical protein
VTFDFADHDRPFGNGGAVKRCQLREQALVFV